MFRLWRRRASRRGRSLSGAALSRLDAQPVLLVPAQGSPSPAKPDKTTGYKERAWGPCSPQKFYSTTISGSASAAAFGERGIKIRRAGAAFLRESIPVELHQMPPRKARIRPSLSNSRLSKAVSAGFCGLSRSRLPRPSQASSSSPAVLAAAFRGGRLFVFAIPLR